MRANLIDRFAKGTCLAALAGAAAIAAQPILEVHAADFVAICEANQVYDTGKPTTDLDRRICQCIKAKFDAKGQDAAIEVFQKVLAARKDGLGLHPSQVDLDELVALMSFSDRLRACTDSLAAARSAF